MDAGSFFGLYFFSQPLLFSLRFDLGTPRQVVFLLFRGQNRQNAFYPFPINFVAERFGFQLEPAVFLFGLVEDGVYLGNLIRRSCQADL